MSFSTLGYLLLEDFNDEIEEVIIGIQEACQFYNYQLTQPSPPTVPTPKPINQIDFAILTAIEPERLALCTALNITDRDRIRKDTRTYWHKRLDLPNGKHYGIILTQAPDMANVDAALLAADTLNHWQPRVILMVGIAAAASRDQKLGDLILGKDIYYYERGKATATMNAAKLPPRALCPSQSCIAQMLPSGTASSPPRRLALRFKPLAPMEQMFSPM